MNRAPAPRGSISERLLEAIAAEATKIKRPIDVLLEVNLSRETNKHGFAPDRVPLLDPKSDWCYPSVYPYREIS